MPVGTPITPDPVGGYYVVKSDVLDEIGQQNLAAYSSHEAGSTEVDDAHLVRRALAWDAKVDAAFANAMETFARFATMTAIYSRLKALGAKWVVAELYRSHGVRDEAKGSVSGFMTHLREEAENGLAALVMQTGQLSARPEAEDYRLTQGRLPGSQLIYGRYW